jgi:hypothetical protein
MRAEEQLGIKEVYRCPQCNLDSQVAEKVVASMLGSDARNNERKISETDKEFEDEIEDRISNTKLMAL